MTIHEARNSSIIPNNLSNEDLFLICKKLGIPANDESYDLNMDEFDKLRYSSDVNSFKIKEEISFVHNKVIKKYDDLINDYKRILEGFTDKKNVDNKLSIESLIFKLEKEKLSYVNNVNNYNTSSIDISYDYEQDINKKVEDVMMSSSNKIRQANANLDKLNKKLQAANERIIRCKNIKSQKGASIKKIEERLEELRKKSGVLNTVQNKIINPNLDKYIELSEERYELYRVEQRKVNDEVIKKQAILDEITDNANLIEMANEEIKEVKEEHNNSIFNSSEIVNIVDEEK